MMNKSILLAFAVLVALGLWMFSGKYLEANGEETQEQVEAKTEKPLMKVSVVESNTQNVQRFVLVQGQVEANRSVEVKVEIDGRVSSLAVDEGERVEAGAPLLRLADDYRIKQLDEAKAILRQRRSDLSASRKLKKKGLLAENRLIADQAAVQTARAQLAMKQHEIDNAVVNAPFTGVLNSRNVEMGAYLQKGNVVGTLVDDSVLKVTGQVPQQSVAGLRLNQAVEVTLNNGTSAFGNLSFISRVADSVTRSYRVEVTLDNPELQRLVGLTATLKLPLGTEKGHLLPNSVLGLNENGELEVKVINTSNVVKTVPVKLIRTDKSGFWLSGLDNAITVITEGKDFVTTGEKVDPIIAEENRVSQSKVSSETLVAQE